MCEDTQITAAFIPEAVGVRAQEFPGVLLYHSVLLRQAGNRFDCFFYWIAAGGEDPHPKSLLQRYCILSPETIYFFKPELSGTTACSQAYCLVPTAPGITFCFCSISVA